MKQKFRNLSVLVLPFFLMIIINEIMRPTIEEQPYSSNGVTAINSANWVVEKCTWVCHNNTAYCKENHVVHLKPYFTFTDVAYFRVIGLLKSTGNYGLANLVFLVVLLPLLIWFFLSKSLNLQDEIKTIKGWK